MAPADPAAYVVTGHDSRLGQVFTNLLDNAVSFSPKGGKVRIGVRPVKNMVEIVIEDDGPGIRADQFERIFERFYTDRPDQESFGQNSGLGLSITKQIVEAHRGRILAENRIRAARSPTSPGSGPGQAPVVLGARFTVLLPAG